MRRESFFGELVEQVERIERAVARIRLLVGEERPRARPAVRGGRRMIHDIVACLEKRGTPMSAQELLANLNTLWWDTTLDMVARSLRHPHNRKLVYDEGGDRLKDADLIGLVKWRKQIDPNPRPSA